MPSGRHNMISHGFPDYLHRVNAITELAKLGDPGSFDLLCGLASDPTLDMYCREKVAWALAEFNDPRAADFAARHLLLPRPRQRFHTADLFSFPRIRRFMKNRQR